MRKFQYKKMAMSVLGYAIIVFIVLGVAMIVSAPFMLNKIENNPKQQNNTKNKIEYKKDFEQPNVMEEIERIERQLSARISNLEQGRKSVSDKYVCTIEGQLDDNGIVVPINTSSESYKKFVFVCEYIK